MSDVEQPELDAASEPIPSAPSIAPKPSANRRMKVRATRAGFIHNERKVEGDIFEVPSNMIGSWFEYQDPVEQKKHLQRQSDKRKKANARGVKDQEKELADE
jgi:hypothetical protein